MTKSFIYSILYYLLLICLFMLVIYFLWNKILKRKDKYYSLERQVQEVSKLIEENVLIIKEKTILINKIIREIENIESEGEDLKSIVRKNTVSWYITFYAQRDNILALKEQQEILLKKQDLSLKRTKSLKNY